MPTVNYDDLENAFEFVSGGELFDASARVSRETGEIFWLSDDPIDEEPPPEDIDDDEKYAEVPSRRDLDLGTRLVFRFAAKRFLDHYDEVQAIFRKKGAYSRFKNLLERHDRLEDWYEYEHSAKREALCEWAEEEGFEVSGVERGESS